VRRPRNVGVSATAVAVAETKVDLRAVLSNPPEALGGLLDKGRKGQ